VVYIVTTGLQKGMFCKKILRRIFGPKRDEITDEWRKLHNVEIHDLYSEDRGSVFF
jgi:hypothetical protein